MVLVVDGGPSLTELTALESVRTREREKESEGENNVCVCNNCVGVCTCACECTCACACARVVYDKALSSGTSLLMFGLTH